MRALWIKDLSAQPEFIIRDEPLHHLVNVIRIRVGEELLLLNGDGLFIKTCVEALSKREMKLRKLTLEAKERTYTFDLALGMPKKESLELCLRQATELGFRYIYLIRSDYSQMKIPEAERMDKLMVSALEQSNAPYLPKIIEAEWESIPWGNYGEALLLDSQTQNEIKIMPAGNVDQRLLIVGPEGGFSPNELLYLHAQASVKVVNLPTPILRTPTALATGAGMMIENLLK